MESTAKYIVPVIGGPMDGAVLYMTVPPHATLFIPRQVSYDEPVIRGSLNPAHYCGEHVHKYLLQPSPARYIYEHLACS